MSTHHGIGGRLKTWSVYFLGIALLFIVWLLSMGTLHALFELSLSVTALSLLIFAIVGHAWARRIGVS